VLTARAEAECRAVDMRMGLPVTVLIVLGDARVRQLVQDDLQDRCEVIAASDPGHARELLSRGGVDIVIAGVGATSDDADNLQVLCDCLRASDVPLAFVAGAPPASGSVSSCDDAPSLFLAEPITAHALARAVNDIVAEHRLAREARNVHTLNDDPNGIVAQSSVMQKVMALVERAALGDSPVLLLGESGTGKELLARALHRKGPRPRGPFVAVNCSAIPDTLLESELFGHRQGAFTDARKDRRGLFQAANHGTIFLDEIGDMAPTLQGKLMRALQEKEVHPLGADAPVPIDVRVVTATHRDLDAMVADGRLRHDLLYRINVIDIHVPPLRDRPEDVMPLIAHFLNKHSARLGSPRATVSAEAMELLCRHSWPGNVRELENVIERALVLGSGTSIDVRDLPDVLRTRLRPEPAGHDGRPLADVERDYILNMLRAVDGNKSAAARALGLDRKTLYRKLGRLAS